MNIIYKKNCYVLEVMTLVLVCSGNLLAFISVDDSLLWWGRLGLVPVLILQMLEARC
jgi:hypothetical protein